MGIAAGTLALALVACGGDDDSSTGASNTPVAPTAPAAAKALALDTAYGTAGIATVPLNAATGDRFMAVAVAPDGKVYGAGYTTTGGDQAIAVARMDATGELDTTFGTGGVASVNVAVGGAAGELARSIVIQASGKIVLGGQVESDPTAAGDAARDSDFVAVRFDSTGKLDTAFGTGGVAKVNVTPGRVLTGTAVTGDTLWGVGSTSGDKVVLWGTALTEDATRNDTDWVLVGLTATGQVDTAFGAGGKTWVDIERASANGRHVLVQPDGKIAGSGYTNIGGAVQAVLVRFNANGQPDTTFGTNGAAMHKVLPGVAEAYNVAMQGSNYVLGGYGADVSGNKVDMIVYRFTSTGQLDNTFGTAGVARIDIAGDDDRARNIVVLPDNRILAVGSGKKDATNIDGMVVLFEQNGALVTTFGENGKIISNLGGPADAWFGVTLSPDKKYVYIAGYKGTDATSGGNDDAVITRIAL